MVTALLSLFGGLTGRLIGLAALILTLFLACGIALREHDRALLAEHQVAVGTAVATSLRADAVKQGAALVALQARFDAREVKVAVINKEIAHAPVTKNCVAAPAVRAALDGLRQPATGHAGPVQPDHANPAHLPGSASAP